MDLPYKFSLSSHHGLATQDTNQIQVEGEVSCYNRFSKDEHHHNKPGKLCLLCVHPLLPTHPYCDDQVSEWHKHLAEIFSASACPASWHHNMMSSVQFMLKNNVIELPKGKRRSQTNLTMLFIKPWIKPHSKLFWDSQAIAWACLWQVITEDNCCCC